MSTHNIFFWWEIRQLPIFYKKKKYCWKRCLIRRYDSIVLNDSVNGQQRTWSEGTNLICICNKDHFLILSIIQEHTFFNLEVRLEYEILSRRCMALSAILSSGMLRQISQRKSRPSKSAFSTTCGSQNKQKSTTLLIWITHEGPAKCSVTNRLLNFIQGIF